MSDVRHPDGYLEIARLGRSHGLAGLVHVHPRDEAAEAALAAADEVWIDGLGEARIVEFKPHGKGWLLDVDRIRRVETAKSLVHAAVRVDPDTLPVDVASALAPAVAGRPVLVDSRPYGTVLELLGPTARPLLRIQGPAGEVLVPATAPYVEMTDGAVLLTDPPAGLLDEA